MCQAPAGISLPAERLLQHKQPFKKRASILTPKTSCSSPLQTLKLHDIRASTKRTAHKCIIFYQSTVCSKVQSTVDLVYIKIKQRHHSRVRRPRNATHHGNQSVIESIRECRADEVLTALQLCVIEGSCDGAAV